MSIQTLNWLTCTSRTELRTVTCTPLCACTRSVSRGPVHWPARSPDLSCLDIFYCGQMKTLVYETPVDSVEYLVARISVAAARDTPGIF
ncbi:hypothetical protein AVEN_165153-1 [Araneus ventricosus]|uniref:Uncharacterized protein n=1 Tax=Araneus ventricosus TaxID=182803 RepID=A0A4Y2B6A9_ARAVE|nr:hypothetical protein AVEN_165153-1 [Araneus ventricosus]